MEIFVDESFREVRVWLYTNKGSNKFEFLVIEDGQIKTEERDAGYEPALPDDVVFMSGPKYLLPKVISLLCSHAISQNMPVPQKDFMSGQLDAQKSQISDFKEIILSLVKSR